ncbi:MAG: hypothetical protein FJ303_06145 [Planctomycetes bacterium]|nr:hypothetical protein [Planctomycetota bacterium]
MPTFRKSGLCGHRPDAMKAKWVLEGGKMHLVKVGWLILVCVCIPGCWLGGSQTMVSKPPANEPDVSKWWQDTLTSVDQATLRCWLQASEYHRQHGSSALHVRRQYVGQTMAGPCYQELHMPTPSNRNSFRSPRRA